MPDKKHTNKIRYGNDNSIRRNRGCSYGFFSDFTPFLAANAGKNQSICSGQSAQLNASGGTTYSWSSPGTLNNRNIPNPIATPGKTTTYTVTISNGPVCSMIDSVIVTVNPLPQVNLGKDTTICKGCTITLHAGNTFTYYKWQDGSNDSVYIVKSPGKYWVTVKNKFSCQGSDTIIISSQSNINLDSGLVACYPFNGNANDESGNGNNGIVVGATLTTDRFGNPNSAYSFDGISNYIYADDNPTFHVNSVTLTVWFYPYNEIYILQHLVSKVLDLTWESYTIFAELYDLRGIIADNNGYGNELSYQIFPVANTWNFAVYTFDDVTKLNNLYFNGKLVASGSQSKSMGYDSHPFQIGAEYQNNVMDKFFYGKLDDIRVYNRALNQNEVQSLYNGNSNCTSCPSVNLGKDTTICEGNTLMLNAGNPGSSYIWNTGATTQTIQLQIQGNIWLL